MSLIIDKRFLPKNQTTGSRQKFIERYKGVIKKRIREMVDKGTIDKFNKGTKKVKIDLDDLETPGFEFEPGTGVNDRVYIGNKHFKAGDKVERDQRARGRGNKGSNGSGGEDDFEFVLSEKEFADLFFEDLALPDMLKKEFLGRCFEIRHAGYSSNGGPTSLNIKKTMLNALGRRIALKKKEERKQYIDELAQQLQGKKKKIQYIEDIDLKYNFKDKVDVPVTRAVMFCLMDVSGSMGAMQKDIAKRFYILLNLFLKRNYEIIDVVFVRHAETAEEVDEDTFFHDRRTGGTLISSGYEKIDSIIKSKYNPEQWNIYIAQASDGDNWYEDMSLTEQLLVKNLLPVTQYFAYMNISPSYNDSALSLTSEVLIMMKRLSQANPKLQARNVHEYNEIFSVFRSLFKKKENK